MNITKRQLLEDAFGEVGLGAYMYDLDAGLISRALRTMDSMMAEWNAKGIRIGYPLSSVADPDDECIIPDVAIGAIVQNVAVRVGPSVGKVIQPALSVSAKRSFNTLLAWATSSEIPEVDISYLPSGAGNKPIRTGEFLAEPTDQLAVGNDGNLNLDI